MRAHCPAARAAPPWSQYGIGYGGAGLTTFCGGCGEVIDKVWDVEGLTEEEVAKLPLWLEKLRIRVKQRTRKHWRRHARRRKMRRGW